MNSNNRFGSETVDDDEFLRHPRSGSGYMLSNQYNQLGHNQGQPPPPQQPSPAQSNNSLEQQRQVSTISMTKVVTLLGVGHQHASNISPRPLIWGIEPTARNNVKEFYWRIKFQNKSLT